MNNKNHELIAIFSKRFKEARKSRGYTGLELARKSGIVGSNISHYENSVSTPTLSHLYTICKAMNISADYLLGLSEEE